MTYVVAEPCVGCKYTDCVAVCPVDCFYELEDRLVINPDECIDCGACEPECPTVAIFSEDELPEKWASYYIGFEQMEANPNLFANNIVEMQDPLGGGGACALN